MSIRIAAAAAVLRGVLMAPTLPTFREDSVKKA
jgi:hypothetical protein